MKYELLAGLTLSAAVALPAAAQTNTTPTDTTTTTTSTTSSEPTTISTTDTHNTPGVGPYAGGWEFELGGSGNNDEDFENSVFSIDASLGYFITQGLVVGGRQNLTYSDISGSAFSGSTVGYLDFLFDFGHVRPFVGVTLGGVYGDGVNDSFIAGPEAGVKFYVKDETYLFGRINYDFLFDSADDASDAFEDGRFVYAFGIGFNF